MNNTIEFSPSSDVNNYLACQEILRLLWKAKFHYFVQNSPPLIPNLSQMHPFYTFSTLYPF